MFDEHDIGQNGCARHSAVAKALREFSAKYPDQRSRMANGAEARRVHSMFITAMKRRELADYALSDEFSKKQSVEQLDRVKRILSFAEKL